MNLLARRHWIFDMDGTLTIAAHDFQGFKRDNGMPLDRPILEVIAESAPERAEHLHRRLAAWEGEIAERAVVAPDAAVLLEHLHQRGCALAILTRNIRSLAFVTLEAAGLLHYFDEAVILGRDSAAPKPAPDGIHKILAVWGAAATDAVMVGDYIYDIDAGRNAGTATVLIDRLQKMPATWGGVPDRVVHRLDALLD
jgi:HAD superfamily hydrolase (TIGR01509 family)